MHGRDRTARLREVSRLVSRAICPPKNVYERRLFSFVFSRAFHFFLRKMRFTSVILILVFQSATESLPQNQVNQDEPSINKDLEQLPGSTPTSFLNGEAPRRDSSSDSLLAFKDDPVEVPPGRGPCPGGKDPYCCFLQDLLGSWSYEHCVKYTGDKDQTCQGRTFVGGQSGVYDWSCCSGVTTHDAGLECGPAPEGNPRRKTSPHPERPVPQTESPVLDAPAFGSAFKKIMQIEVPNPVNMILDNTPPTIFPNTCERC